MYCAIIHEHLPYTRVNVEPCMLTWVTLPKARPMVFASSSVLYGQYHHESRTDTSVSTVTLTQSTRYLWVCCETGDK